MYDALVTVTNRMNKSTLIEDSDQNKPYLWHSFVEKFIRKKIDEDVEEESS